MEISEFMKNFSNLDTSSNMDFEKVIKVMSTITESSNNNSLLKIDNNINIAKMMVNLIDAENSQSLNDLFAVMEINNFMQNYREVCNSVENSSKLELKREAINYIKDNLSDESIKIIDVAVKIFEVKDMLNNM